MKAAVSHDCDAARADTRPRVPQSATQFCRAHSPFRFSTIRLSFEPWGVAHAQFICRHVRFEETCRFDVDVIAIHELANGRIHLVIEGSVRAIARFRLGSHRMRPALDLTMDSKTPPAVGRR